MTMINGKRFVPVGKESLADDAPGWLATNLETNNNNENDESDEPTREMGPICWKCKGSKKQQPKKKKKKKKKSLNNEENADNSGELKTKDENEVNVCCRVCQGRGYMLQRPPNNDVGRITSGRRKTISNNNDSILWYPLPHGWNTSEDVQKATLQYVNVEIPDNNNDVSWYPQRGEELCNLVGQWRILQKKKSHRWTTDDLVTAFVASNAMIRQIQQQQQLFQHDNNNPQRRRIRYLDLGTGNASVLQMVLWRLLHYNHTCLTSVSNNDTSSSNKESKIMIDLNQVVGVEARSEAVGLARRSLTFNMGPHSNNDIEIIHGDFRTIDQHQSLLFSKPFDLITGTPPYFEIQYSSTHKNLRKSTIQQGGMPTCKQSAPARCEFRGGIEAYCEAASRHLSPDDGIFCVCENWLNHERVVQSATDHGLYIVHHVVIHGKERGPNNKMPLFGVYVMKKKNGNDDDGAIMNTTTTTLTVRDENGNWTKEYKEQVLLDMGISC